MVYDSQSRYTNNRFLKGLLISILFHIIVFIVFQYFVRMDFEQKSDYSGPIVVNIETEKELTNPEDLKGKVVNKKVEIGEKDLSKTGNIKSNLKRDQLVYSKDKLLSKKTGNEVDLSVRRSKSKEYIRNDNGQRGEMVSPFKEGEIVSNQKEESTIPEIPSGFDNEIENKKSLPFKPGVEVEEGPMAFNLKELDQDVSVNKDSDTAYKGNKLESQKVHSEGHSISIPGTNSKIEWESSRGIRRVVKFGPKPVVPEWVKTEGLKLTTTVVFKVNPDGNVFDVKVVKSSGFSEIDAEIVESVRKIVFEPIKSNRIDVAKVTYVILPR